MTYVTRFVPAYRWPVLRAFNERLGGGLTVASGEPPGGSSLRSLSAEAPDLAQLSLRNRWVRGEALHWQSFDPVFRANPGPDVLLVEESPRTLSLRPLIRASHRRGIPVALWGHFSSIDRGVSNATWRDRYRLETARRADAVVAYTDELGTALRPLLEGTPVFSARNTLDTDTLFPLGDTLQAEGRTRIRQRLGLPDVPTILFLGRLIAAKGVLRVVDVARQVAAERGQPSSLVVVGDGPERAALEQAALAAGVKLHCTGALVDAQASAPWIAASDVLLNPGYLGLSVNHAFALGVPVVAPAPGPNGTGHSPEWAYVRDGHNGVLATSNAAHDLTAGVLTVLADAEGFGRRAAAFAREHLSMARMVDGLMEAVGYLAGR
ncbi:MAG: glycosyltransferase family 4 protein [Bacteroidetes bacterium]|nr:glycosyltransferase family 4 protein [Bacteroidota bacterium]